MIRRVRPLAVAVALAAGLALSRATLLAADGSITGVVSGQGATHTVVYVEHAGGSFKPPAKPPIMDQHGKAFIPHVLPVLVGTSVEYHNQDPFKHNVFSPDYGGFNLGAWGQGATKNHAYDTCKKAPCVYRQMCLIHPHMLGYVVVLQNPYFAKTDDNGHYTITGVPAGKYTLAVWHDGKLSASSQSITVTAGGKTTANFSLK
ncbi:MAG: carboxypeptidase regulatory-like domain-containing protein [Acidobacteriota bacterium]|nr:carboxypeptidase regulatory-like domain-containing protein [Acidobacteriota bacterium]